MKNNNENEEREIIINVDNKIIDENTKTYLLQSIECVKDDRKKLTTSLQSKNLILIQTICKLYCTDISKVLDELVLHFFEHPEVLAGFLKNNRSRFNEMRYDNPSKRVMNNLMSEIKNINVEKTSCL